MTTRERITDELSPEQFLRQMTTLQGPINPARVVAWNEISDHDAALRARVRFLDGVIEEGSKALDKIDTLYEEYRAKYKEQGEALRLMEERHHALRDAAAAVIIVLSRCTFYGAADQAREAIREMEKLIEGGGEKEPKE